MLRGSFDRITPSGDKLSGKLQLWLTVDGNSRSVRLTGAQKVTLLDTDLAQGDSVEVQAAPTVSGSRVKWLVQLVRDAKPFLD